MWRDEGRSAPRAEGSRADPAAAEPALCPRVPWGARLQAGSWRCCRDPARAGGRAASQPLRLLPSPWKPGGEFAPLSSRPPRGDGARGGKCPVPGAARGDVPGQRPVCVDAHVLHAQSRCAIAPARGRARDAHACAELTPVPAPGAGPGLRRPPQPWGLAPGGSGQTLPSPRRAGASRAAWSRRGGLDTPFSCKLMAVPGRKLKPLFLARILYTHQLQPLDMLITS